MNEGGVDGGWWLLLPNPNQFCQNFLGGAMGLVGIGLDVVSWHRFVCFGVGIGIGIGWDWHCNAGAIGACLHL